MHAYEIQSIRRIRNHMHADDHDHDDARGIDLGSNIQMQMHVVHAQDQPMAHVQTKNKTCELLRAMEIKIKKRSLIRKSRETKVHIRKNKENNNIQPKR
jgi:hypothetical protein